MKVGHRFPTSAKGLKQTTPNTFIAKGLQNRQTNLFQLFNNVPWLPRAQSRFTLASFRIGVDEQ